MISIQEMKYLEDFAKLEYSGQGEIVDLGCWLGASTIALASGLKANLNHKAKEHIIHAYDIFIWEAWMNQCVLGTPLHGKYRPGESFINECLERIRPWNNQIQVHSGDIRQLGWNDGPIELLFIDAMKSWELANSILQNFFPALIPGHSVIVHQDFAHYYPYWIHLLMYRLQNYFEPIYYVPYSWSVIFKYQKPVPDSLLKHLYSLSSFSRSEIDAAFDYSIQLVSEEKRPQIIGAKVMVLMHLDAVEEARLELEKAKAEGMSSTDLALTLGMYFSPGILEYLLPEEPECERLLI